MDDNLFMHTTHQKKALCPLFVIKTSYWEFGVYAFLRVELKSKEKSDSFLIISKLSGKKLFYKIFKIVGNLRNKTFCSIDGLPGPKIPCHFDHPVALYSVFKKTVQFRKLEKLSGGMQTTFLRFLIAGKILTMGN